MLWLQLARSSSLLRCLLARHSQVPGTQAGFRSSTHFTAIRRDGANPEAAPIMDGEAICSGRAEAGGAAAVARVIWSSFLWGAVNARLAEMRIDGRPVALEP